MTFTNNAVLFLRYPGILAVSLLVGLVMEALVTGSESLDRVTKRVEDG